MKAGQLRHRVTIEHETVTRNSFKEEVKGWLPFATVWASVEPIKGKEYFSAQQVNAEVTHRVTMRYLAGVTAKMRVLFGERILELASPPINVGERNRELQLMCIERGSVS